MLATLAGFSFHALASMEHGESGLAYEAQAMMCWLVAAAVALIGALIGLVNWPRLDRWSRVVVLTELALCSTVVYLLYGRTPEESAQASRQAWEEHRTAVRS